MAEASNYDYLFKVSLLVTLFFILLYSGGKM